MLSKKHLFFLFFFSLISIVCSQENTPVEIDTLINKDYDELKKIFYDFKNSSEIKTAKRIAYYALNKAKNESNKKEVANSYIRLCGIVFNTPDIALKYIDSSITIATKNNYPKLLAISQFHKARTYYAQLDFEKSLMYYVKAKEYYDKTDDKEMYYAIQNNIGLIKQNVNAHEEALHIFKECYLYDLSLGYESIRMVDHLATISSLSLAYVEVNKPDSATLMNRKGYKLAITVKDYNPYKPLFFTNFEGLNQYTQGNYIESRDSLLKAVPFLIESNANANLCYAYFRLGKISNHFSEKEKAIFYYKKVDSIFLDSKFILPEPREIYESLINYYKEKDDVRKQLYYTERLLNVDSVLTRDYKKLIHTLHKEYDTPELKRQKKQLEESLNKKDKGITFLVSLLLIISIISLLVLRYFNRKRKRNEEKFNEIIENLKQKNKETIVNIEENPKKSNSLNIHEDIVNSVLEKLNIFEQNEGFLEPKLSLTKLAKYLETNNKYLSNIINTYKSKTYNAYIHDLRIDYAIDRLQKDEVFRKYTIKAIASDIGYTNTESFTMAFHKKTGITVSFFIKKINSTTK